MRAIAVRELEAYYNTMIGYAFMSICLLVTGIFFASNNLIGLSASFNDVLGSISYVMILITPLLTMRLFAEDRKNKTEQMLLTAPVSIGKIVIGKYMAAMSVLILTLLVTAIFPAILFMLGTPSISEILLGYFGLILLSSAFISIGMFISANTVNQLTAAVSSMGVLLLFWLVDALVPSVTNPALNSILNAISLYKQFESFLMGVLSVSSVVYFVSFTLLFLFFTMRSIEKRRWSRG